MWHNKPTFSSTKVRHIPNPISKVKTLNKIPHKFLFAVVIKDKPAQTLYIWFCSTKPIRVAIIQFCNYGLKLTADNMKMNKKKWSSNKSSQNKKVD